MTMRSSSQRVCVRRSIRSRSRSSEQAAASALPAAAVVRRRLLLCFFLDDSAVRLDVDADFPAGLILAFELVLLRAGAVDDLGLGRHHAEFLLSRIACRLWDLRQLDRLLV